MLRDPRTLRRAALAGVIANVGIVVTGGLVRLTGSGLGCPTWPSCTDESYVANGAVGYHGAIEFGNRSLAFVVTLIAAFGVLAAYLQRDRARAAWPASIVAFAGVAAQAVLGGVTVRMALNPWTVASHFLLSMAVIAAAYVFWRRTGSRAADWAPPQPVRGLAAVLGTVCGAVLVLGTVVTGSGPHAGDQKAARTGFDPQTVAQLHADGVFLLIGLSLALWFTLRAVGAPATAVRAIRALVLVELAQGAVGFIQYFAGLPWPVVALHLLGASLTWLATLAVLAEVRVPGRGRPRADRAAADQSLVDVVA
jgi:heme a synthase